MDADSNQPSYQSTSPLDIHPDSQSSDQSDARCIFCRRAFLLETESNDEYEAIFICRDCKLIVLDDLDITTTIRDSSRRRRRQREVRAGSSESIEALFSQQFSDLLGFVRHNQETQHHASHNMHRGRSRRWRRPLSDNGSDGLDHNDSLFGESDSNFSFSGNGAESDASVDGHSTAGRDLFLPQDDEIRLNSDTDIDPMNAALERWDSDEDEEYGEWEEADTEEDADGFVQQNGQMRPGGYSPSGSSGRYYRHRGWMLWRAPETNYDSEMPQYTRNSGDFLDARGFEELLEQLAENDNSRRGAPPAATSFVRSLPRTIISKTHEKNGTLVCAVCKENLMIGSRAIELPCQHFYHPSCILPWFSSRNSCPVCRYELPTDDPDYEEGKRNIDGRREFREIQRNLVDESSSDISTDSEQEQTQELHQGTEDQGDAMHGESGEGSPNRQHRGGWIHNAAAPIISIVGIVLILWLGSPVPERRRLINSSSEQSTSQVQRSARISSAQENQVNRNRRWWSLF